MTTPKTMLELADWFEKLPIPVEPVVNISSAPIGLEITLNRGYRDLIVAALRSAPGAGYISDLKFANKQNIRVAREWKARAEKAEAAEAEVTLRERIACWIYPSLKAEVDRLILHNCELEDRIHELTNPNDPADGPDSPPLYSHQSVPVVDKGDCQSSKMQAPTENIGNPR